MDLLTRTLATRSLRGSSRKQETTRRSPFPRRPGKGSIILLCIEDRLARGADVRLN